MSKSNSALENFVNSKSTTMLGGGYSFVADPVGQGSYGAVKGYDDVAVHDIAAPGSCVSSSKLVGGAKRTKKRSKKRSCRKMKKGKKTKKYTSKKYNSKSKRHSGKSKRRSQRGGGCGKSIMSGDNFPFTGELSNHSPDTATKNYGAKQPSWGPEAR